MEKIENQNNINSIELKWRSITNIVNLSQRTEYLINNTLDGLTIKQLLVLIEVEKKFNSPPSLSEIAKQMKVSYQNIKQIVDVLEKKKFVSVVKDLNDKRSYRIILTDYHREYWDDRSGADMKCLLDLFEIFEKDEEIELFNLTEKLLTHINILYDEVKK